MKDLEPKITHQRPRPKSAPPKPFSNVPKDTDPHGISASMDLVKDITEIERYTFSPKDLDNLVIKAIRIRKKFRDNVERD